MICRHVYSTFCLQLILLFIWKSIKKNVIPFLGWNLPVSSVQYSVMGFVLDSVCNRYKEQSNSLCSGSSICIQKEVMVCQLKARPPQITFLI